MRWWRKLTNEESGQALVLVALMMVGLLGFAALVVDVGISINHRRALYNAADAAVLAAAASYSGDGNHQRHQIEQVAYDVLGSHGFSHGHVEQLILDEEEMTVELVLSDDVEAYFASILGIESHAVRASVKAAANLSEEVGGNRWKGDNILPAINSIPMSPGTSFNIWQKQGPGNFMVLWRKNGAGFGYDYRSAHNDFIINYQHDSGEMGVLTTNGALGNSEFGNAKNVVHVGGTFYLFGTKTHRSQLSNKEVIPFQDLVIYEVKILQVHNNHNQGIDMRVENVFHIEKFFADDDWVLRDPDETNSVTIRKVIGARLVR